MFILKKLSSSDLVARSTRPSSDTASPAQQFPRHMTRRFVPALLRWRALQPALEPHVAHSLARQWAREAQHAADSALGDAFALQITTWLDALLDALPEASPATRAWTLTVPLWSRLTDLSATVQILVEDVLATQSDTPGQWGGVLGQTVIDNLCRVARLSEADARARPHRLIWPKDSALSGAALVEAYLGDTLLGDLLTAPHPLAVEDHHRLEHTLIVAGSGHGKTQTLQHLIVRDALRPETDRVGMIVIDSQGDMIATLSRVRALADRILLIDAADVDTPPALNLFDLGGTRPQTTREQQAGIAGILQLYTYVIGGLFGAELTSKQATTFSFLIRLMLDCPGATIHTLRECLEDPTPFAALIAQQSPTARQFFEREFIDRHFAETRRQLLRRLYGVLQNPVFERMFASSCNRLDLGRAMADGRIVLINTSREVLQDECRVFGRYCIALALKAAFDRSSVPAAQRRTAFLYIDEASDYIDEAVVTLLAQARKYKLGVTLAHQALDQLPDTLRALVLANTGIKLVGGTSAKDARVLADDMRSDAAMLLAQHKQADRTDFAAFVRGLTPTAARWTVPFFTAEQQPRWTDTDLARVRQTWRNAVSAPHAPGAEPKTSSRPAPAAPTIWDDFSEPA